MKRENTELLNVTISTKFQESQVKETNKWLEGKDDLNFAAAVRLGLRLLVKDGFIIQRGSVLDE